MSDSDTYCLTVGAGAVVTAPRPRTARRLLRGGFGAGLAGGVVGLIAGAIGSWLWERSGRARPAPVIGPAVLVGTAVALLLSATRRADLALPVAGGALIYLGAGIGDDLGWKQPIFSGLVAIGAFAVFPREPRWVFALMLFAVPAAGLLLMSADRRWGASGMPTLLLVGSVAGMYVASPEVKPAALLLGVVAPVAILAWPLRVARIGTGGSLAVVAIFGWAAREGGLTRPAAIVGSMACLGLLLAEPVARALGGGAGVFARLRPAPAAALALGGHAGVVYVASRVAGLETREGEAAAISIAVLLCATVVLLALDVTLDHRRQGRPNAVADAAS